MQIEFLPIKTRIVHPPQDDIWDIIESLEVKDGDIVFITSKIIAIHQGRTRKVGEIEKSALIREEAERMLPRQEPAGRPTTNLTIVQGTLILAAGIDQSNADGYYILWPQEIDQFCQKVRMHLMTKFNLKRLGVVATDSHSSPLRAGVTGLTIGLAGVEPLRDIRGSKDLFGRSLEITRVNLIDPITSMAVSVMGENAECTPIVIARGDMNLSFNDTASMQDLKISPDLDYYRPLLEVLK